MTLTRCPVFKYFWKNYREIQGQLEVTEKETLLLYTIYKAIAKKTTLSTQILKIPHLVNNQKPCHLGTN